MAKLAERITVDPEQCGGRPCIRGMRIRVTDVLDLLANGEGEFGKSSDPEICNCHHVRKSTIVDAICNGCDSLPRLSDKTRAGTGCGSCRGQLADLILKNAPVTVGSGKGQPV